MTDLRPNAVWTLLFVLETENNVNVKSLVYGMLPVRFWPEQSDVFGITGPGLNGAANRRPGRVKSMEAIRMASGGMTSDRGVQRDH